MYQYNNLWTRSRKYILYLLAGYVLGWGFTPYQTIFLGLILGTSFSLYNLWLLIRKSKQFQKAMEEGRAARSIGTISRMAIAGLAVLIALKFPEYFHLFSVIIGLMTMYVVIMIDYIFYIRGQAWEER
ncbi:ATP synthase subunit I [Aeribacillus alveayuensis]|uniref:ATP synthase protein I n=1 Tax=Aeribacillus alveayuensis TaxID=279215 RepID=A0ABT9VNP9_9BACI|nr:ATP synthase protein I [Bacillus alveayuensis]